MPPCFAPETLVLMHDGTNKQIRDVKIGDFVLGFNALDKNEKHPLITSKVSNVIRNFAKDWIVLDCGLRVTPNHRFYTTSREFLPISEVIQKGIDVYLDDGSVYSPKGIYKDARSFDDSILNDAGISVCETFNLTVETLHTYIAGRYRVHNECLSPSETITDVYLDKDNGIIWNAINEFGSKVEVIEKIDSLTGETVVLEKNIYYQNQDDTLVTKTWREFTSDRSPVGAPEYDVRFNGEALQPDQIGDIFGSTLGNVIAGNNTFAQIAVSTALGTVLENLYEIGRTFGGDVSFIEGNPAASHDLESHIDYNLSNFDTEFYARLKGQAIGALSSFLVAELSESLDIGEGFGGQLFQTVGTTTVSNILSTVAANLEKGAETFSQIFANVGDGLQFNLASGVGGFIGGYLANQILTPESTSGSIGGSSGGALGSSIGVSLALGNTTILGSVGASVLNAVGLGSFIGSFTSTLGAILLPGIGALLGTLIGTIAGDWLNDVFGDEPRAWASIEIDHATGTFSISDTWRKEGGNRKMAIQMAESGASVLNNYVSLIGGVHVATDDLTHRYGHRDADLYVNFRDVEHGNRELKSPTAQGVIDEAVIGTLKRLRLAGGEMYVKRAIETSAANDNFAREGVEVTWPCHKLAA